MTAYQPHKAAQLTQNNPEGDKKTITLHFFPVVWSSSYLAHFFNIFPHTDMLLPGRCLWNNVPPCSSASESILSMGDKVGLRHIDRQEVGIYISLVFNDNLSVQGHLRSRWDRTTDHWPTQPTWLSLVIHITSARTPPNPRLIEGGRRVARLKSGWVVRH